MDEKELVKVLKEMQITLKSLNDTVKEHSEILQSLDNRTKEHTELLKSLEHKTDVQSAKIDSLTSAMTEIKDDVHRMEIQTAQNYLDIAKLKAAK
jgi:methyl-accepting chemotaxis protein